MSIYDDDVIWCCDICGESGGDLELGEDEVMRCENCRSEAEEPDEVGD